MIKLYFAPELPGVAHNILYGSYKGTWDDQHMTNLFQSFPQAGIRALIQESAAPQDADYILVPHNYSKIASHKAYLEACKRLAKEAGRKLMIVAYGDSHEPIPIDDAVIFRSSQYRDMKASNEIIMPAYIEEVPRGSLRRKGKDPSVGFIGRASTDDILRTLRDKTKMLLAKIILRFDPCHAARIAPGTLVRSEAMASLERAADIATSFVIRTHYSGNIQSIEGDPKTIRTEYVDNIISNDLTLAPKGDGNYSLRFYETLSAGRIPLLIDTCMELPLTHLINYDAFIVRVDFKDLLNIDARVRTWWDSLDDEAYALMQHRARAAFDDYLRIDRFFMHVFDALV